MDEENLQIMYLINRIYKNLTIAYIQNVKTQQENKSNKEMGKIDSQMQKNEN